MSPVRHGAIDADRRRAAVGRDACAEAAPQATLAQRQKLVSLIERAIADPAARPHVRRWGQQRGRAATLQARACDTFPADPIAHRAFEALVAAFDRLASEAARRLTESAESGREVDPARDVSAPLRVMQVLLDRAALLADDDAAADAASRRVARLYAR